MNDKFKRLKETVKKLKDNNKAYHESKTPEERRRHLDASDILLCEINYLLRELEE